jgi:hypothetical protein
MIASALFLKGSTEGVSSFRIFGDEAYPNNINRGGPMAAVTTSQTRENWCLTLFAATYYTNKVNIISFVKIYKW